ncbi:MAG: hypothetical protein ACI9J3_001114 [Parvicellaceae bacterium]|jgi:hypothetical protein
MFPVIGITQTYISESYESGQLEGGAGIIQIDDTIFSLTWQYDLSKYSLLLAKIDTNGNRIFEYSIADTVDMIVGLKGFFEFGNYFIGYGQSAVAGSPTPLIFKFDRQGNVLWLKNSFPIGALQAEYDGGVIGNDDSSFVFTGTIETLSNGFDVLVAKTDTFGNIIYEETIGGVEHEQGYSIVNSLDTGYVISGYTKSTDPNGNHLVLKVNENCQSIWLRQYGTSTGFEGGVVTAGINGYWICGTWDYSGSFTSHISKLDSQGFIINSLIFSDIEMEHSNLFRGTELPNKEFIGIGIYKSTSNTFTQGWIIKVDSNCNELWNRKIDIRTADHFLNDVIISNNSTLLACGYVGPDGSGNTQDLWIVGMDSLGCDSLGCHTLGISEFVNLPLITIWPNPTASNLNISFESPVIGVTKIYNQMGQLVHSQLISGEEINLDLSFILPGVHHLVVSVGGRQISKSFIKSQ